MLISSPSQGPIDFGCPSSSFTSHNRTLEHTHLPTAPVSLAGSLQSESIRNPLGDMSVSSPHCDCIFSFLMIITSFTAHLTKSPIPFQVATATSRTAIAAATYSLTCSSCYNQKSTLECISVTFFVTLLPKLAHFYNASIEAIEAATGHQTVQFEGNEISIGIEQWKTTARNEMIREASKINFLVGELGKLNAEKHIMIGVAFRSLADVVWGPVYSRLTEMSQVTEQSSLGQIFTGMC